MIDRATPPTWSEHVSVAQRLAKLEGLHDALVDRYEGEMLAARAECAELHMRCDALRSRIKELETEPHRIPWWIGLKELMKEMMNSG
jgi:hypothetical protein